MRRMIILILLALALAGCGDTFYEVTDTPEPDATVTEPVERATATPSQIAGPVATLTPAPVATDTPPLVCPVERLMDGAFCYPVYTRGVTPIYDQAGNLVDEFSAGQEIVILWPCALGECKLWGPDSEGGYLWVAESALTLELED